MKMNNLKKAVLFLTMAVFVSFCFGQEVKENPKNEKNMVEKVTAWYMENINYGTITLLMAVESSFIPFPSEVVVPPAAYKALEEESEMNIFLVVVFATVGAILGAIFNYYLAMFLGRPIIYRFAESKLGRMCLLSKEKVIKAENYFDKHGKVATFIGRLVPGIRQLISIPAGLAKMKLLPFIGFTALGAGIWNIILAILGYIGHGNKELIEKYSHELSYVLVILGILFVLYLIYKGLSKKKTTHSQNTDL